MVVVEPNEIVPSMGAPRLLVAVPPLTRLREATDSVPACPATGPVKVFAPPRIKGPAPVPFFVSPPAPVTLPPMLMFPVVPRSKVEVAARVTAPLRLAEKLLPFTTVAPLRVNEFVRLLLPFKLSVAGEFTVTGPVPSRVFAVEPKETEPAVMVVPPL